MSSMLYSAGISLAVTSQSGGDYCVKLKLIKVTTSEKKKKSGNEPLYNTDFILSSRLTASKQCLGCTEKPPIMDPLTYG